MSAGRALDAVRFDDKFIGSDPHASTIRTAGQMDAFIVHGFVLRSTKTIDRLSIEKPWTSIFVDDRQDKIMMVHLGFQVLLICETVFDQLAPQRFVESMSFRDRLRRPHSSLLSLQFE